MGALRKFLGLIIFFLVLCVLAGLAFVVYSIVNEVTNTTRQKMEKRNISFSKEGMQVKMKHRTAEQESDAAQNVLTKVWSAASPPPLKESKSWLGGSSGSTNTSAASTPAGTPSVNTEKRKPFSRSASSQQSVKKS